MADVRLSVGDSTVTWQVPPGGWGRIDLVGTPGGVSFRFYGETADGRVITGSTTLPSFAEDGN